MKYSHYEYRKNNPHRPLHWRWALAEYWLSLNFTARKHRDEYVIAAVKLQKLLNKTSNKTFLLDRVESGYEAWRIYNDRELETSRWELEAKLLTGVPLLTIAEELSLLVKTVEFYEAWFFNVLDRLDSKGYITHHVIGTKYINEYLGKIPKPILWKLVGYTCGAGVLDILIHGKTTDDNFTLGSLDKQFDTIQGIKGLVALNVMGTTAENGLEHTKNYIKLRELRESTKAEDEAKAIGLDDAFINIYECAKRMPWFKMEAVRVDQVQDNIEQTLGGACLRSEELLLLGSDELPETVIDVAKSAQFPEHRKDDENNKTSE